MRGYFFGLTVVLLLTTEYIGRLIETTNLTNQR